MKRMLLLAMVCLAAPAINARPSEREDTLTEKTHQLQSVTVTERRPRVMITSGRPIQLMQKEEIELLGLQNLADAVKRFAGTSVRDYGGIGGMKTVSVRNLGAHHTAVSYDGVTVSNTQAGQIDIGRYSIDNIQSLSLAIGEQQDFMLSARHYASAGVLSLETERPSFEKKDYALRFRLKGGSFGLISPMLRYWQQINKRTAFSVDGTYMRADGIYPFTLVNGTQKSKKKRNNSDIFSWKGEANLYHQFADSSQLDMKLYWFYSERGLPGGVILYKDKNNERLWDEDFFVQAVYTKHFSDQWNLKTRLKYTHTWNKYEDTDVKYQDGKQTDIDRQNEYYGSVALGWEPMKGLSFALAEDVVYNDLRNNIIISANEAPPFPKRFTSLTALSARWAWKRLKADANVVGTYATETVRTGKKPDDHHRLSPSFSLSYRLLNNEALYVRAMLKNTFRLPTFNDLYYRRMGNTGLRPERATEYNVGLTWSGQPVKAVKYLTITVDGYYNDVKDKIVAFPSTYIWRMANYGKVCIRGIDATIATEVPIVKDVSVMLTGAYTYQKAIDKTDGSASYNRQIPYTPIHSGNGALTIRTPWLNVGYSVLMQGKRWSSSQRSREYVVNEFAEHTLSLSRELKFRHCSLLLQGAIHNLTNEQYEIIKYYPMPGRSWTLTGTFNL